jgi:hypothetical protein
VPELAGGWKEWAARFATQGSAAGA